MSDNNPIREERGARSRPAVIGVGGAPSSGVVSALTPAKAKYKNPPNIPLALGISVLGAAVVGAVLAYVTYNFFSYPIVLVALAAALVGFIVRYAARAARVRSRGAGLGIALLSVVVILAVYAYAEYGLFWQGARTEIINQWARQGLSVPDSEADEVLRAYLVEETGRADLLGYRQMIAQTGIEFTSTRSSGASTLTGSLVWVMWGLELLLALYIAGNMTWSGLSDIFCDEENHWLTWQRTGYVRGQHWDGFREAMARNDVMTAASYVELKSTMNLRGWVRLEAGRCEAGGAGWLRGIRQAGRRSRTVLKPTYTEADMLDALAPLSKAFT